MRIGDGNPEAANPNRLDETKQAGGASGQPAQGGPDAGKSGLSAEADSDAIGLSSLSRVLAESPTESSRIDELRLQVQQGTYEVPAKEIARKIVDFHTK